MQNTSEQQYTASRANDADTQVSTQPRPGSQHFLLFMLAGFVFMTALIFAGMYIIDVTAVVLNKPAPAAPAALDKRALDSMAAAMKVPDDPALTVREGLVLWLKADALTRAKNGDSVQVLPDASGIGNNAIQPVAATRPTFVSGALNGKPVLRFDGADDHYFLGNLGDSSAATIAIVWQKPTSGGNAYQRVYSSSFANIDYLSRGAIFIPLTENNGVGTSPARLHIAADTLVDLRNFYIGRLNASPEQFYYGDLAEMLIYRRVLPPAEQQALEAYLKNKYGL